MNNVIKFEVKNPNKIDHSLKDEEMNKKISMERSEMSPYDKLKTSGRIGALYLLPYLHNFLFGRFGFNPEEKNYGFTVME